MVGTEVEASLELVWLAAVPTPAAFPLPPFPLPRPYLRRKTRRSTMGTGPIDTSRSPAAGCVVKLWLLLQLLPQLLPARL